MSNELNALRDALENQNIDQIKFLLEKYHINITKIEPKQDCKDRLELSINSNVQIDILSKQLLIISLLQIKQPLLRF